MTTLSTDRLPPQVEPEDVQVGDKIITLTKNTDGDVRIVASVVGSVGFEPGGALLTAVAADTPGASGIVRCTVSGACELAQTVDRGRAAGYAIRAS